MNITKSDFELWAKVKAPSWAHKMVEHSFHFPIDSAINARALIKFNSDVHNYLVVLRMVRKHGGIDAVLESLEHCIDTPYPTDSKRKQAFARKWYARIMTERLNNIPQED
jgi:hypothetical protein